MAILTRTALDALWINGFIPDEDDYIDRADTLIALASSSGGLTQTTGNWTPSMPSNFTVGSSSGTWSKIGDQMAVWGQLSGVVGNNSANGVTIQGLPEHASVGNLYMAHGVVTPAGGNSAERAAVMYFNNTSISIFDAATGSIMDATLLTSATIRFAVSYRFEAFS